MNIAQRGQLREAISREWKAEISKTLTPKDNCQQNYCHQYAAHHCSEARTKEPPFGKWTYAKDEQIVQHDIDHISCQDEPHR